MKPFMLSNGTLHIHRKTLSRWLLTAGLLILALLMLSCRPDADIQTGDRNITIQSISGSVEVKPTGGDAYENATAGRNLVPGDMVRTGERSQTILELDDGTIAVISENTLFEVQNWKVLPKHRSRAFSCM